MIDVRDLRIGNYVINENSVFQLRLTDDCELVWHFVGSKDFHFTAKQAKGKMKPIPITPEWLEKLGFEPLTYSDAYENDVMGFRERDDGWQLCFLSETNLEEEEIYYQYVHEIQNVYYALAKEELTIGGGE